MQKYLSLAWERFTHNASIVGEKQAIFIVGGLYYTVVVPFGLIYSRTADPMRLKAPTAWLERPATPSDIESAQQQG